MKRTHHSAEQIVSILKQAVPCIRNVLMVQPHVDSKATRSTMAKAITRFTKTVSWSL